MTFLQRRRVSVYALFVFGLLIGLGVAGLLRWPDLGNRAPTFATIFLGSFIEAAPFLLLGTVASGLVEEFISAQMMRRLILRGRLSGAVSGAALGFLFPVTEYGNVPLARRLLWKGAPLPLVISFLLAAPVINPIVLVSTAGAFGWGAVLALRFALTAVIAVATALVFSFESQPDRLLRAPARPPIPGGGSSQLAGERKLGRRLNAALEIAAVEFVEMGQYLILGSLLAALLQMVIPESGLLAMGNGPVLSIIVMLALSVILSVSSTGDAFVAQSFAGMFSPGSLVAFLVYGPMIDAKSILMYLSVFTRKTVAYLALVSLSLSLLTAVFINFFL